MKTSSPSPFRLWASPGASFGAVFFCCFVSVLSHLYAALSPLVVHSASWAERAVQPLPDVTRVRLLAVWNN